MWENWTDMFNEPLFWLIFVAVTGAELVAHSLGFIVNKVRTLIIGE